MKGELIKKISVYSVLFFLGVIIGSFSTRLLYNNCSTKFTNESDKFSAVQSVDSVSRKQMIPDQNMHSKYNSNEQVTGYHKATLDELLNKLKTQKAIINYLQNVLNEETKKSNLSFGTAVYNEFEKLGLEEEDILGLMQNFVKIKSDDIPTHMSIEDFTIKLLDIAGNNIINLNQNNSERQPVSSETIKFSTSVHDNVAIDPRVVFNMRESKIFATFNTGNVTDNFVLAKWYRTDSPEIIFFDKVPIDPNAETNSVWLDSKGQSKSGQYKVEVYSFNDGLDPIASGEYSVIDNVPEELTITGKFL